jgi:arginase
MAMTQVTPIVVLGAASAIGIRPYDGDLTPRCLDRAPAMLRAERLVARLGARYLGEVSPPAYRDLIRPAGLVRNERELEIYSRRLGERVGEALGARARPFLVLLGGDCSIVLGALLGARKVARRVGLVYVDAHADFATPQESLTGSAASMCLAMAVGRGDTPLARLAGAEALVRERHVALVGRRDGHEPAYGHAALAMSAIRDLTGTELLARGPEWTAAAALDRAAGRDIDGFWIHVDADVLDAQVMPAVDSPEPGGPGPDSLAALLRPLVTHPKALGLQLTIYDPALDTDRQCARRLVDLLHAVLTDGTRTSAVPGNATATSHHA